MKCISRLMILVGLIAGAVYGQDWTPVRIVAITNYVPLARMARVEGDVVVKCSLDKDGSVAKAEIVSGPALLKEQARANALLWKFQRSSTTPAVSDVSVTLTYQYRLDGERPDDRLTSFSVDLPNIVHIVAPVEYVTQ